MADSNWATIISASVVPVVIISACGLLCLAFYNRLGSIVSRLRAFQRERIQEQEWLLEHDRPGGEAPQIVARHQQFLAVLEIQTVRVTRRARLIRNTLMCLLGAIAALLLCSLASGLSVPFPAARYSAVAMFLGGVALILLAMIFAMMEIHRALEPIELEAQFVRRLTRQMNPGEDEADSI